MREETGLKIDLQSGFRHTVEYYPKPGVKKLVVYFLIRFYTAYLTPDMYSTADIITQTAKLLRPFIALSISEAIFRFALDKNED